MAIKEGKYFKRRARRTSITAVISVAMVLFLLGLVGLIVIHAKSLSRYIKENLEVQVFIKDNTSEKEIQNLQKQLKASNFSNTISFVSKKEASEILKKDLGEDFVDFLGHNPLLASLNLTLNSNYANSDSLKNIEKIILRNPAVDEVEYQEVLFDLINNNISKLTWVMLIVSLIFFLISAVIINNSIKLALHSRRFLVKTMQLVGATQGFIQKPYILKGLFQGFISGLIAVGLIFLSLYFLDEMIPELKEIRNFNYLMILVFGMLILGILIALTSTFFSVKKYLRSNVEELYTY